MANNDFQILLGAKVNTAGAQKEIDKIIKDNSKRKIDLNLNIPSTADFKKQLKQIQSELNSVTTNVREYTTAQGQLVTKYEQLDKAGNRITNVITQQTNAYGDLTTKTQVYYKTASEYNARLVFETEKVITKQEALVNAFKKSQEIAKFNNEVRQAATAINGLDIPVKKTSTTLREWVDSQGKLITETRKFDNELGTTITQVSKYTNSLGQAVTETKVFNDNWELLSHDIQAVKQQLESADSAIEKTATSLNKASVSAKSFGEEMLITMGKVAKFYVATLPIQMTQQAIENTIETVNDFDAALTEFKKVSDLSGESLDRYTEKLGELGEAVARSRTQMVEAATEFKKSGYSNEQSAELAQIASLFQNVADSELSAGDAADYVISQMKAFGMTSTEQAQGIIDKTNEVSNNFAVSSTDISQALTKTSSAMAAYGNTIDETISLTTAGAEILNGNVGKVAKGLRSIGANITNLASASDTMQISVNGSLKTIQLINEETGDMLSTYDVLEQISQYWDDMNSSEQSNLALTLANKTQFEVFTSVLSNFDSAERALTTSLTSQGSAWKENEAFLQSNEASINSIKASLQELILNSPIDEFIKLILQATAGLLKFANSGFGQVIIYSTLAFNGLNLLFNLFDTFNTKTLPLLITKFAALGTSLDSVSAAEVLAKVKTLELGAALELLGLNPLVLAITAVVGAITLLNHHIDEERQRLEEINSEIESFTQQNEDAVKTIEKLKEQIAELNENKLEITDPEQLSQLEAQSAELENQLRLQYDLIEANKQKIKDDYEEKLKSGQNEYTSRGINLFGNVKEHTYHGTMTNVYADQKMQVEQLTEKLKGLQNQKESLGITEEQYQNYLETGNGLSEDAVNKYEKLNEKITSVNGALTSAKGDFDETTQWMQSASDAGVELTDTAQGILDSAEEVILSSENQTMTIEELSEKYGVSVKAINAYQKANEDMTLAEAAAAVAAEQASNAIQDQSSALQTFVDYVSSVSDAYGVLSNAVDEYNETGGYSLETLNKLIPLMAQYGNMFEIVDGQIIIHTEDMYSLIEAEAEEQKSVIRGTAISKLNALEQENSGKKAKESGDKHKDATAGIDENTASLNENTEAAVKNAQAQALQRGASKDDVENIVKEMQANIDLIDKAVAGMNTSFADSSKKAAKRSSGSHKSAAKESKDAWLEAYKAEKDTIDSMYKTSVLSAEEYAAKLQELSAKYLTDSKEHQEKYAKEIHSIYEEMYKALQKSLKEALDEEEKRLKKSLDDIKDQKSERVKAVKRENEEALKGIKKQIDALKDEKKTVEDSFSARIDALKSERKEYERQVALMKAKEKLAKAKATYQYVMDATGKFAWMSDQHAVDEANEEKWEEERNQQYERELDDLEKAKDKAKALYEKRIDDLEKYYDSTKEAQDKALEQLEDYFDKEIKARENAYNTFKEQANAWLNGQYQVMADENTIYGQKLANLKSFVDSYNAMLSQLGKEGATASNNYSGGSGSKPSGVKTSTTPKGTKNTYADKNGKQTPKPYYQKQNGKQNTKIVGKMTQMTRASGDAYTNDGAYIVGENPHKEIVLGSKLNNGVMMNLSKGSGVVNAKSTRTLAGLLNSLNPNGLGKMFNPNTTNNNTSNSITISNVSLPNVKDGADFISYLQNFDVDMLQRAY